VGLCFNKGQGTSDYDDYDDEGDDDNADSDNEIESACPIRSAARYKNDSSMESSNQCSECFHTYEEDQAEAEIGFEWVKCVCQRWAHEDCVTEALTDKHGRDLIVHIVSCNSCAYLHTYMYGYT